MRSGFLLVALLAGPSTAIAQRVAILDSCSMDEFGFPSLVVALRDQRGQGVARGAALETDDGEHRQRFSAKMALDSLSIGNERPQAGTFRIRVTKPGYAPAETSGVRVPGDRCGRAGATVRISLLLRELPNAPRVRDVVIQGGGVSLGPGAGGGVPMHAYVNGAAGADTSVIWSSSDTTALTVTPEGLIGSRDLLCKRVVYLMAAARADPRVRARQAIDIWGSADTERPCLKLRDRPDGAFRIALSMERSGGRTGSMRQGVIGIAPYVSDHLQFGVTTHVQREPGVTGLSYGSETAAFATYYVGGHWKSRPHIGVFATSSDHLLANSGSAVGVRAGWTYSYSRAVALAGEVRVWKESDEPAARSELGLRIDPYVLGGARISRRLPAAGVVDLVLDTRLAIRPHHDFVGDLTIAPFLNSWLQLGGSLGYNRTPDRFNEHFAEGFGRAYLISRTRRVPFVGLVVHRHRTIDAPSTKLYGAELGIREHLNRDVALDLVLRNSAYASSAGRLAHDLLTGSTSFRLGVITQLRTRGRTRAEME